jgi:hypothetical protein
MLPQPAVYCVGARTRSGALWSAVQSRDGVPQWHSDQQYLRRCTRFRAVDVPASSIRVVKAAWFV